MLKAYFDDSRMGQPPCYVLGGWIAPAKVWAPFSDAWLDILWMKPRIEYFKFQEAMNFSGECQVLDPYGVYPDLPAECDCVGRCDFARAPGTGLWIEFGDLPEATREALRMRARDSHPASTIDDDVPF